MFFCFLCFVKLEITPSENWMPNNISRKRDWKIAKPSNWIKILVKPELLELNWALNNSEHKVKLQVLSVGQNYLLRPNHIFLKIKTTRILVSLQIVSRIKVYGAPTDVRRRYLSIMFCYLAAITCPSITITSKGLDITPSFCTNVSAVIHYATDCRFTCRSGYQHYGPGLKTCNQQKTWSPLGNPWCKGGLAALRNLKELRYGLGILKSLALIFQIRCL